MYLWAFIISLEKKITVIGSYRQALRNAVLFIQSVVAGQWLK